MFSGYYHHVHQRPPYSGAKQCYLVEKTADQGMSNFFLRGTLLFYKLEFLPTMRSH